MFRRPWFGILAIVAACNPDPGEVAQGVDYRPPGSDIQTGERGTVPVTEVFWSGSVTNEGHWDPTDVFIELRNEGTMPLNLSGWQIRQQGSIDHTYLLPSTDQVLEVGAHWLIVAKTSGCFPEADMVIPELSFRYGEPLELTVTDFDEHLIDPAGSDEMPPFAGGYDQVRSRSMEKIELMFGGDGTDPHSWHFYTPAEVEVPNNDRIAENCRQNTMASPGRPNSPDYSGAFAAGSLE